MYFCIEKIIALHIFLLLNDLYKPNFKICCYFCYYYYYKKTLNDERSTFCFDFKNLCLIVNHNKGMYAEINISHLPPFVTINPIITSCIFALSNHELNKI